MQYEMALCAANVAAAITSSTVQHRRARRYRILSVCCSYRRGDGYHSRQIRWSSLESLALARFGNRKRGLLRLRTLPLFNGVVYGCDDAVTLRLGEVPANEETAIWKRFQEAREKYSDNLKINKELRDYDFKKNLETKQLLLNEASELVAEEDVITAYRRLQELHNKWRRIGPVAKEMREEIWNKFKEASAEINKRYQAHFEARKAREAENEAGKTAICEQLESIDFATLKSFAAWDAATKVVMELQEKWRSYGFASRKMNKALFARFRELCDKFFSAKAEYFQTTREELANNLARKTALAERAEALRDSTDWKRPPTNSWLCRKNGKPSAL